MASTLCITHYRKEYAITPWMRRLLRNSRHPRLGERGMSITSNATRMAFASLILIYFAGYPFLRSFDTQLASLGLHKLSRLFDHVRDLLIIVFGVVME